MAHRPTEDFGRRLKELRESAGYSQEELAGLSGVSRATIANAERGVAFPYQRTRNKLARVLGVEGSELSDEPQAGAETGSFVDHLLPVKMARLRKQIKRRGDEWGLEELERRLLNDPPPGERWALESTKRELRRKSDRKRGKYRGDRIGYLRDRVGDELFDLGWLGPAAYSLAEKLKGERHLPEEELDELEEGLDVLRERLKTIDTEVERTQREIDERRARPGLGEG